MSGQTQSSCGEGSYFPTYGACSLEKYIDHLLCYRFIHLVSFNVSDLSEPQSVTNLNLMATHSWLDLRNLDKKTLEKSRLSCCLTVA